MFPTGSGYLELGGGWWPSDFLVYGEVGYKPLDTLTLFGRGEHSQSQGSKVIGGLRWTW